MRSGITVLNTATFSPLDFNEETRRHERSRTHLALDKDTPIPRPIMLPGDGAIVAIPEVGGLHHRYERRAA